MEIKSRALTAANMQAATGLAHRRAQQLIELGHAIECDSRQSQRLQAHECKTCFYTTRISGRAMTMCSCAGCGVKFTFTSLDVDVLCHACAVERQLCKHCGGDINMNYERASWPSVQR